MKKIILIPLFVIVSGCESLDHAMIATNDAIFTAGDLIEGDLRPLSSTQSTTLSEIWKDWQQNEVAAKDKWSTKTLAIPGVVTRVTTTGIIVGQNKLAVVFSDPSDPRCSAQALTRDDLKANKIAINKLQAGDRVTVTGVLDSDPAMWSGGEKCWFTIGKAKVVPAK